MLRSPVCNVYLYTYRVCVVCNGTVALRCHHGAATVPSVTPVMGSVLSLEVLLE